MKVLFCLSMLHEPGGGMGGAAGGENSATRKFRGRAILGHALSRLARVRVPEMSLVGAGAEESETWPRVAVVCWSDQVTAVQAVLSEVAGQDGVVLCDVGPRKRIEQIEGVSAAQRWAQGWRGGPLHTCHFDRGFHGPSVLDSMIRADAEAVVLVDPAAGLLDPDLITEQLRHAQENPERKLIFSNAAPGFGTALLWKSLVEELARNQSHPGKSLTYVPDCYTLDPANTKACSPTPAPMARTLERFTLDCPSQIERFESLCQSLSDEAGGEELVRVAASNPTLTSLPRELVLELTRRRNTAPIFRPTPSTSGPAELPVSAWLPLLDQVAGGETRLLLAGSGDPLLYPEIVPFLSHAARRGIPVAVETDMQGVSPDVIQFLGNSSADLLLAHLPGVSQAAYARVMGGGELSAALNNLQALLNARGPRSTPLIVPVFTKTTANLGEMEPWYDHWLRLMGSAVIEGASTFAGQIPSHAVTDLSPATRIPCRRLMSRMMILCDGRAVPCEFDVRGTQSFGGILETPLAELWHSRLNPLRVDHKAGRYSLYQLCSSCTEWHRP